MNTTRQALIQQGFRLIGACSEMLVLENVVKPNTSKDLRCFSELHIRQETSIRAVNKSSTYTGVLIMKSIAILAMLLASISAHAANTSANHGHHGGGSMGAAGAAAGAFGGSASASVGGGASGGNGGSYGDWYLRSSPEDAYQPWPQSQMQRFQRP